jgi:hypothetical protein
MMASADTQAFATCLADALNGKERKLLVKWIYFSMATHPELEANSSITEADRDSSNKATGSLITRLFVEDCPNEAKIAQKSDPMAIRKAFEFVGQVAMQEIITNQKVITAIGRYVQYTDQNKINALFVE